METARIFIIYAREDAAFKDDLIAALSPLKKQGWIQSWHDGDLKPGAIWDQEIRRQLNQATLILPLVSPDFFASEYIQDVEIARAFEQQKAGECQIVPIIIRACAWETDAQLARLQALPSNSKPIGSWPNKDEAYEDVVQQIKILIRPQTQGAEPSLAANHNMPASSQNQPIVSAPNKIMRYKTHLEIAAALVAVLTFVFTYCPIKTTGNAAQKALEAAKSKGSITAIRDVLDKYPNSQVTDEAKVVLHVLELRYDSCLQSAKALRDGGEHDAARAAAAAAAKINPDAPELKVFFEQ